MIPSRTQQTVLQKPRPQVGGLAAWLYQRFRNNAGSASNRPQLQMLEQVSLNASARVALVQCGSQLFLAGFGAQGVNTLVPVAPQHSVEHASFGVVRGAR